MIGGLVLLTSFFLGLVLISKLASFLKKTAYFLPVAFFLGTFWTGTIIFGGAYLFLKTTDPLLWSMRLFGLVGLIMVLKNFKKIKLSSFLPANKRLWLIIFIASFLFSWWFFQRTFRWHDDTILVASNEYLDFGAHVPIIRSFSQGNNFPAELPFYSGKPIFYHFLFDFTTAIFEKMGWSIAFSYNLLSALSLAFLFVFIFYFSQEVLRKQNKLLGSLSVLFFLLTPDLSFIYFFKQYGLKNLLNNLKSHNFYLNNGLTVNKFFGGFFNINVFTNQRHLVFGLGLFFVFILFLYRLSKVTLNNKTIIFTGLILGLLPFWHNFVFMAIFLLFGMAFLMQRNRQVLKILIIAFLIALPQIIFIQQHTENQILFRPGFLIHDDLTLFNWLRFWFYNLGFGLLVTIGGWLVIPRKSRRFLLPFLALFIIPNLFSFAKESFNDHKFFVVFSFLGAVLSAWFLIWLWQEKYFAKAISCLLFVLLIASGFLNLLVVKNDTWVSFKDVNRDSFLLWVSENSQPGDIFLTNLAIWDPVNFTGRKKFLGRPHYLWAYGFNPSDRMRQKIAVLAAEDRSMRTQVLRENGISFIALNNDGESFQESFFEADFSQVYQNSNWRVYQVE